MAIARIQNLPRTGRRSRRPNHSWNLRARPWQIQPFMIAPVIPGETLKSAVFQERCVTDPVANRLVGWWHELYIYYVPLLATSASDLFEQMVITPDFDPAPLQSGTAVADHYFGGRNMIDYVSLCLEAVVEHDFRDEGETAMQFAIDGLPAASINREDWTQSILAESEMEDIDVNVDLNSDDEIMVSEIEQAQRQYMMLRDMDLVDMSYEDYLRTFGIRGREATEHKGPQPELLRYVRDWQYPANTPDAQGNVNSVVSWRIAERADKDRFFKHPGFIFGVQVSRPKVYLGNTVGAAVGVLDGVKDWLPAMMSYDPYSSLKLFADGQGPLDASVTDGDEGTQGYWIDLRDLFLYGDQFVNHDDQYRVDLPATDLQRRYAQLTDLATLFVGEASSPVVKSDPVHVESDGTISMTILGRQTDVTPRQNVASIA